MGERRRLVMLDEVGSTNDEALALGRSGAPHGTAVAARNQTAGRGRRGHVWESPRGNLYLSVVLRPAVGPARLPDWPPHAASARSPFQTKPRSSGLTI